MSSRPLFASPRERRLWLLVAVVQVAILATLGLAQDLIAVLRDRGLLEPVSWVAVAALVIGLLAWFIRRRPGWSDIGIAAGVALAFWVVAVRIENPGERSHLVEYGVLAALIHAALLERVRHGRHVPMPAAIAIAATALLGILDEAVQWFLPDRVFDLRDVGFNLIAGFMVVTARLAMAPQRAPGWRIWFLWLMAAAWGWGNGVYWGWYIRTDPKLLARVPEVLLAGYLGVAVGALTMASLQALVIRRHLRRPWRWVVATMAALAVVGAVMLLVQGAGPSVQWYTGVWLLGPCLAVAQWWLLREATPAAGWWVVVTLVAWGPAMLFGDYNGPPGFGAIYASATGAVLVWLLRGGTLGTLTAMLGRTGDAEPESGGMR